MTTVGAAAAAKGSAGPMACAGCGQTLTGRAQVRLAAAQLVRCDECGVWTYWPRPSEISQTALHDSAEYFEHPYFERRREMTPSLDRRCSEIFERIGAAGVDPVSLKGQRVLDVGCDTGAFLLSAKRQFGIVPVGVDVAARSVRIARDSGVEAYHSGIDEAPLEVRDFPLITAIDLIEHVSDPMSFLGAIRERLLPGGVAYIETPNIESVVYGIGGTLGRVTRGRPRALFQRLFPDQHIQYFTRKGLSALVRASGLELLYLGTRILPGRDIAASLPIRLGMAAVQMTDRIRSTGILICAVLRRPH